MTASRCHARAVGHEDVLRIPYLIVAVEHRGFGVATHPRRSHLVDAHAGIVAVVELLDALHARGLEHLRHVAHHVATHETLVLADRAIDLQHRESPLVLLRVVEADLVVVTRQHLAERGGAHLPAAGLCHRILEGGANAELRDCARPTISSSAALVAEPAEIIALVAGDIAIPRDVEACWAATVHVLD